MVQSFSSRIDERVPECNICEYYWVLTPQRFAARFTGDCNWCKRAD